MSQSSANRRTRTFDVRLAEDGSAVVEATEEVRGTGASAMRATYEARDQRLARITQRFSKEYPGVEVEKVQFSAIDDILAPVVIQTSMKVPRWGDSTDGGLRLPVRDADQSMVRALAPQVKRTHPMVLGVPGSTSQAVTLHAPRGQRFVRGPNNATVESPFGKLTLTASFEGANATYRVDLMFATSRVDAGEYADFRAFLASIDDALNQVFETEGTP